MYDLSVIIPFRCENEDSLYLLERLEELCKGLVKHSAIEFIVVDSGSLIKYSKQCEKICQDSHCKYLFQDTRGKSFSLGGSRDYGVQHASGNAISFLDVDLRVSPTFWDRLLVLMKSWGISEYKKSFLAVPCLYLTKQGTDEFLLTKESESKYQNIYLEYLQGQRESVESFAACSSVMVVDRLHYLSIGGHNPEFDGHGYEDFELYHRLMGEENIIPRADAYLKDTKNWTSATYNGFRSQLSIIARPALMMNLMVFHLWHPRPKKSSFYNPQKLQDNRNLIFKAFEDFDKNKNHPAPLISADAQDKNIVFFGKLNTSAFDCIRNMLPILGNIMCLSEYDLVDLTTHEIKESLLDIIALNNIKMFLFPNPYGNPARQAIYNWCRLNSFPYLCFERGALPDSWFLDENGFNADSLSYKNIDYSKNLSQEVCDDVSHYIYSCLQDKQPLEIQGERKGGKAFLESQSILGKKVLFVPLQRPSDTVIKHFIGDVASFDNFISVIDKLAGILKSYGWVTIVKKHPLETIRPQFANAIYAPDSAHFLDLLEACDASALINSGVGVYSMMMQKPCYIFGDAFYQVKDVNQKINADEYENQSALEVLSKKIISGYNFDTQKMLKFISFLKNEFYSFGLSSTKQRKEADGSLRTITTGINFYDLKLYGRQIYNYLPYEKQPLSRNAPLFERYALDIYNKSKRIEPAKQVSPKEKPKKIEQVKPSVTRLTKVQNRQGLINVATYMELVNSNPNIKKLNKLRNNPYKFFDDAKVPLLRKLRVLFE